MGVRYAHPVQRLLRDTQGLTLLRRAATKEMLVTGFSHPAGAGKVTFPCPFRPVRLSFRVDVKHDAGDFAPICTFGFRIEQSQIGHEALFVIFQ